MAMAIAIALPCPARRIYRQSLLETGCMKTGLAMVLAALSSAAAARPAAAESTARERHLDLVQRLHEQQRQTAADRADVLCLPGLRADRQTRQVRVLAETTALRPGDVVEFLLIGLHSGHDYEALAVSFAKPSDVHRALEFIGLSPGRGADPAKLQFRPRGERVLVSFRPFAEADPPPAPAVRAEDLILDTARRATLPRTGFVFIGSRRLPAPDNAAADYAADRREPGSIIANYNEAESVLDVPREAPQQEVYNRQVAAAGFAFGANRLLEVLMEPEYPDGRQRCFDAVLRAAPAADPSAALQAQALDDAGRVLNASPAPAAALEALMAAVRAGRTPFVKVQFDERLTLGAVRELCAALNRVDTDEGLCVDAPEAGQLYYRAFLPNEKFRDRAGRLAQPWELRFTLRPEGPAATLTQIEQVWHDNEVLPELRLQEASVPAPPALRQELDRRGPGLPVILAFAPANLTYGQLLGFIRPVLDTHPTVHVFVEQPGPAAASAPTAPPRP